MAYAPTNGLVGAQSVGDLFVPTTDAQFPLGQPLEAIDPIWGFGEFIYGKATAAHGVGRCVTLDQLFATTDIANAAGTNRPFYVACANMAIGSYGWYAQAGNRPVQVNATVAANAVVGVAAAGILGAGTTTKYAKNIQVQQSQTYAPTVANCFVTAGSKVIQLLPGTPMFVGLLVSGVGIPGGSSVAAVDPGGQQITLNNAATASGTVTLTFTWTGFSWMLLNRPFLDIAA
jgi:hypothetical protein